MVYNSATMTLEQVIDVMKEAESKGQTVARLHTGDPCLYGAIREQIDALDALGIAHDDCPGVSSFCGAAAALEMEYTLPDISQSVVITRMAGRTPVRSGRALRLFAAHQATMVVFLSTGLLEELSRELIAGGYTADTPAAIVYKATWPEEKTFVCTVGTLAETAKKNQITKTALMIIGNAVSQGNYRRSDLYNPAFTTEFREAENKMKIAIASFTRNGCAWNQKLCAALKKHSCEGYALEKYGKEAGIPAIAPSLPAWTERMFQKMDAILFIGACGIAVRSIAPYVKSKKTDPAVLCMDEQGKFVISLLSGHIGGANELTEEVAAVTGAVPVH